jgi:hypothetical protein
MISHFGTYTIDEAGKTIAFRVEDMERVGNVPVRCPTGDKNENQTNITPKHDKTTANQQHLVRSAPK